MTKEQTGQQSNPKSGNAMSGNRMKRTSEVKRHGSIGMEELKGNVCACGVKGQAERCMKTAKATAECVGVTHSKEMWTLVEHKQETMLKEPNMPGDMVSKAEFEKHKMLMKQHMEDQKRHQREKAKAFGLMMGQCTVVMKNEIEGIPECQEMEKKDDAVQPLQKMREPVCATDNVQCEHWTMQAVVRKLVGMRQEAKESLTNFG